MLDSFEFEYDYSALSKIFNAVVNWCDNVHGHRLNNLAVAASQFSTFNQKILSKLQALCPQEAVPPEATDVALFGDGTRVRTARPGVTWDIQRLHFSGDKWYHCQGAQGTTSRMYFIL